MYNYAESDAPVMGTEGWTDFSFTTAMWENFTSNATMVTASSTPPPTPPPMTSSFQTIRYVCEVGISLPIAILGLLGNLLAFIVLCHHRQRLSTTVLLQALAISDTLVLICGILLRAMRYVGSFYYYYSDAFMYLYRWGYPTVYFLRLANTWITVFLTIDRYIAVCMPLHAARLCNVRRAYIQIASVTLASLVFSLPRFFEFTIYHVQQHGTMFGETSLVRNHPYNITYRITLFFLVMYFIPMGILITLNSLLLNTLHKADAQRISMQSFAARSSSSDRPNPAIHSSRSTNLIVVTIVLICITCNLSALISHIIWSLQLCYMHLRHLEFPRRYLSNISNIMVTINCAINFVVYCVCSRKFRTVFVRTFRCKSGYMRSCMSIRSSNSRRSTGSGDTGDTFMMRTVSKEKLASMRASNGSATTRKPLLNGQNNVVSIF